MKPYLHAESSAKKFGGIPNDYLEIHSWFDASKENFPDNRHRALRHHTQGIFDAERVFGVVIINSDGKKVSVRDIGEQHVLEDLGFIPTLSDYFSFISYQGWMHGEGLPPSLSQDNNSVKPMILDGSKPIYDFSKLKIDIPCPPAPPITPYKTNEPPFFDQTRIRD